MSEYYSVGSLMRNTLARAEAVLAQLQAISAGFDLLPTPAKLREARQNYAADTGAADAYVVALDTAPASYTTGMEVVFKPSAVNTGASTINVNGLGVKSILRADGTALAASDLPAGAICVLRYDGANFRLMNAQTTSDASLPLAIANGGTGAQTAAAARTALGSAAEWRETLQLLGLEDLTPYANADFGEWQRGATALDSAETARATSNWSTANPQYGPDQWLFQRGSSGVGTVTRQNHTLGQTDVPGRPKHFARMAITTAGTGDMTVRRRIEGVHRFAGQTITFGVYVRCNLAARSITPKVVQNFGTTGSPSGAVTTTADAVNLTQNAWTLVTATVAVPSISGKTLGSDGNDYLELQWDLGAAAIGEWDFSRFLLTPGAALGPAIVLPRGLDGALCRRYFEVIGTTGSNDAVGEGIAVASTSAQIGVYFAPKRAAPTMTPSAVTHFQVINGAGGAIATTNLTFLASQRSANATATTAGSLTAGQGALLQAATSARRIDVSAEL